VQTKVTLSLMLRRVAMSVLGQATSARVLLTAAAQLAEPTVDHCRTSMASSGLL
jgi:hypothetical protein